MAEEIKDEQDLKDLETWVGLFAEMRHELECLLTRT